jgi:hypothetical protein
VNEKDKLGGKKNVIREENHRDEKKCVKISNSQKKC